MQNPSRQPVLLIHGGAWAIPDDAVDAHQHGIATALAAGWAVLSKSGSALDAVQAAITVMEDDDTFDAGRGSFLTRDGRVQLDALMMDGATLRAGGVACVERLRNPIQAARLVLDKSQHVYFVGIGAERFATQHGMRLIDNTELIVPRERDRLMQFQRSEIVGAPDTTFTGSTEFADNSANPSSSRSSTTSYPSSRPEAAGPSGKTPVFRDAENNLNLQQLTDPALSQTALDSELSHTLPDELRIDDPTLHSHDTVGAVALDIHGNLAAGTSTGGTLSKAPGRVGDSSLIGCGCYADNACAAVSLTGWGEPIMKLVLGKWAVDRVAAGAAPQQAATDAMAHLYNRLGGHGGIILLAPSGSIGLAHNTPRMAWGIATSDGQQLGITRND